MSEKALSVIVNGNAFETLYQDIINRVYEGSLKPFDLISAKDGVLAGITFSGIHLQELANSFNLAYEASMPAQTTLSKSNVFSDLKNHTIEFLNEFLGIGIELDINPREITNYYLDHLTQQGLLSIYFPNNLLHTIYSTSTQNRVISEVALGLNENPSSYIKTGDYGILPKVSFLTPHKLSMACNDLLLQLYKTVDSLLKLEDKDNLLSVQLEYIKAFMKVFDFLLILIPDYLGFINLIF